MEKRPAYTIGTLVNNWRLYEKMRRSMQERGFSDDCEFITIDNSSANQGDGFNGLNRILNDARGEKVILCHQDVQLVDDGRQHLDSCLTQLDQTDPFWAIAGNAGCRGFYTSFLWHTDRFGRAHRSQGLPERVYSLDENFLVLKSEARLSFSRDLTGFHMYGSDICTIADILGWSAYVIPFNLVHHGEGKMGKAFDDSKNEFARKWRHALRHREMQTTTTQLLLVGENCPAWYSHLKRKWLRFFARRRAKPSEEAAIRL